MTINLDLKLYPRVEAIEWLSHCGESLHPGIALLQVQWVEQRTTAIQSMLSIQWSNALTVAKGRLTGYLAKKDYDTYGTTWNSLAKQSQALLKAGAGKRISDALEAGGWLASLARTPLPQITPAVQTSLGAVADLLESRAWDQCLSMPILVDLNLAALEITYRRKFPKAPIFFGRLLEVYEAGHLPCGWVGDLDDWPNGELLVH